jgi:hypothetical protein
MVLEGSYRSTEASELLHSLTESMNTKRTEFTWSHLDSFYGTDLSLTVNISFSDWRNQHCP